jgi:hypothetical protein
MLVDGPHHGKILDQDAAETGLTIVMHRIPDDGPMVRDLYRWTQEITLGGLWLAAFTGTEAIPAPGPEPLEPGSADPAELDPALTAYLDWPLYFPDDSVHCDNFPACPNADCHEPAFGQVYLASHRRMTIREFLADIKAHAESGASDQSG